MKGYTMLLVTVAIAVGSILMTIGLAHLHYSDKIESIKADFWSVLQEQTTESFEFGRAKGIRQERAAAAETAAWEPFWNVMS